MDFGLIFSVFLGGGGQHGWLILHVYAYAIKGWWFESAVAASEGCGCAQKWNGYQKGWFGSFKKWLNGQPWAWYEWCNKVNMVLSFKDRVPYYYYSLKAYFSYVHANMILF